MGGDSLFRIALCSLSNSRIFLENKFASFFGSVGHSIIEFETIDDFIASNISVDVCIFNQCMMSTSMQTLVDSFNNEIELPGKPQIFRFLTFVKEPISDEGCERMISTIQQFLEYNTMFFAVNFLTDKGFKSIALSKILFFEFYDRKVKIKTQDSEYLCNDTLHNVMSLVGSHNFSQPHKSFIVNLMHITNIKNYIITMNDSSLIPLSQKKSREFRKLYKGYLDHKKSEYA